MVSLAAFEADNAAAADAAARRVTDEKLALQAEVRHLSEENAKLRAQLFEPELHNFARGLVNEAAHQRQRWGASHDEGKWPEDWFWLIGYLAGKALRAAIGGDRDKALHHCISAAAACANWHAAIAGTHNEMRPGIKEPVA